MNLLFAVLLCSIKTLRFNWSLIGCLFNTRFICLDTSIILVLNGYEHHHKLNAFLCAMIILVDDCRFVHAPLFFLRGKRKAFEGPTFYDIISLEAHLILGGENFAWYWYFWGQWEGRAFFRRRLFVWISVLLLLDIKSRLH